MPKKAFDQASLLANVHLESSQKVWRVPPMPQLKFKFSFKEDELTGSVSELEYSFETITKILYTTPNSKLGKLLKTRLENL